MTTQLTDRTIRSYCRMLSTCTPATLDLLHREAEAREMTAELAAVTAELEARK